MKFGKIICSVLLLTAAMPAFAGEAEKKAAEIIGTNLVTLLSPETIEVTVADNGKNAWIECIGADLSGVRIDSMKLNADLTSLPKDDSASAEELSKYITSSRGEIRLLESDVNNYFASGKSSGNFSDLKFDFKPAGYYASGKFSANLVFINVDLDLEANGKLGLHPDGVYLEKTEITTQGMKQPDNIVSLVTNSVNPLLSFEKIPFPVTFKRLEMKDKEVMLTGEPKKLSGGNTWRQKR
ncbi:MAG: LmeA family phospholipid-binding protein [Synergistes sp.]|nr:LmeA family phospholipid-binding protein [Synergistes sp.]